MLNITSLIQTENRTSRRRSAAKALAKVRTSRDAKDTLNRIVYELGLRNVLTRAQVKQLAAALQFPPEARPLFRVGGELVFILAEQFQIMPEDELRAVFAAITPNLTYKRRLLRGDNPKELRTAWVYVEIEPPTRRLPVYEIGWNARMPLWMW